MAVEPCGPPVLHNDGWFERAFRTPSFTDNLVREFELLDVDRSPFCERTGPGRFGRGCDKSEDLPADSGRRSTSWRIGGAEALDCRDTGRRVAMEELLHVPGLVLYAFERLKGGIFMIFVQVSLMSELRDAPFLDRGIRALAQPGASVYVAELGVVEGFLGPAAMAPSPRKQGQWSFVWNTGRCGSTLMHRMLSKVGVISFSEPFWFDQLMDFSNEMGPEMVLKVFISCATIDTQLAQSNLKHCGMPVPSLRREDEAPEGLDMGMWGGAFSSFNPKGGAHVVMEGLVRGLPNSRHIYMYRDVCEVVESLGSIFASQGKRPEGEGGGGGEVQLRAPCSRAVAKAISSGSAWLPRNQIVRRITYDWMNSMSLCAELRGGGYLSSGNCLTLSMDDFVRRKNGPDELKEVLRFVLGPDVAINECMVKHALEAFGAHSQAGHIMENTRKNPFLTDGDLAEIRAAVAVVSSIATTDFMFGLAPLSEQLNKNS